MGIASHDAEDSGAQWPVSSRVEWSRVESSWRKSVATHRDLTTVPGLPCVVGIKGTESLRERHSRHGIAVAVGRYQDGHVALRVECCGR